MSALAAEHKQQREWARLRGAFSGYTHARKYHKSSLCVASTSDTVVGGSWSSVSNCRVFHPESLMRPADPGQLKCSWLSSGRSDQLRSAETSSVGCKIGTRFASALTTRPLAKPVIFAHGRSQLLRSLTLSDRSRDHPPTAGDDPVPGEQPELQMNERRGDVPPRRSPNYRGDLSRCLGLRLPSRD